MIFTVKISFNHLDLKKLTENSPSSVTPRNKKESFIDHSKIIKEKEDEIDTINSKEVHCFKKNSMTKPKKNRFRLFSPQPRNGKIHSTKKRRIFSANTVQGRHKRKKIQKRN